MNRDFLGGLVMTAIAAAFIAGGWRYPTGELRQIGAGAYPLFTALLLAICGFVMLLRNLPRGLRLELADPLAPVLRGRPVLSILIGMAAFGLLVAPFGLLPATFVAAAITCIGDRGNNVRAIAGVSLGIAITVWILFILVLDLPLTTFRMPF